MSESNDETIPRPTDTIVEPIKNTKQYKLQLTLDGVLHQESTLFHSDFNIITRYDIYEEEHIDEIASQLVVQHSKLKPQQHLLDLYFYDKDKTKEYRYWITFSTVTSVQNEIDHEKGVQTLKMTFDTTKEFILKGVPIEIVSWLSEFLFSL